MPATPDLCTHGYPQSAVDQRLRRAPRPRGLWHALALDPAVPCQLLIDSGLPGRGGAAFLAGINWLAVLQGKANQRYVAYGADEGDSGSFSERFLPSSGQAHFLKQNLRPNSIIPVNELSKCPAATECPIAGVTIGIKYKIGSRSAIAKPYRIAMLAAMPKVRVT